MARAAAAHRGLRYQRRGGKFAAMLAPIEWTPELAYAVGLIATDGCLYGDGRHIAFISKDLDLMRILLSILGKSHIKVRRARSEFGGWAYRAQFSHAHLYRWLLVIGLMPRKSLVIAAIDVPEAQLLPLARGLLDGDGTVYTLTHCPTRRMYPGYRYTRLWTFFLSASRKHVEWLQLRLSAALGIQGRIEELRQPDRKNPVYRLKYGNRASLVLLPAIYADVSVPRLQRKWRKWDEYRRRHLVKRPHDRRAVVELMLRRRSPTG